MNFAIEEISVNSKQLVFDKTLVIEYDNNQENIVNISTKIDDDLILLKLIFKPSKGSDYKNIIFAKVENSSEIKFDIYGFDEYSALSTRTGRVGNFDERVLFFKFTASRINDFTLEFNLQLLLGD